MSIYIKAKSANIDYMDLYCSSLSEYVTLPANATFEDIANVVKTNSIIGYEHNIKIGDKNVIALRKYTWSGKVAKTSYLHVYVVNQFEKNKSFRVIEHWKEQKDGSFKTI